MWSHGKKYSMHKYIRKNSRLQTPYQTINIVDAKKNHALSSNIVISECCAFYLLVWGQQEKLTDKIKRPRKYKKIVNTRLFYREQMLARNIFTLLCTKNRINSRFLIKTVHQHLVWHIEAKQFQWAPEKSNSTMKYGPADIGVFKSLKLFIAYCVVCYEEEKNCLINWLNILWLGCLAD